VDSFVVLAVVAVIAILVGYFIYLTKSGEKKAVEPVAAVSQVESGAVSGARVPQQEEGYIDEEFRPIEFASKYEIPVPLLLDYVLGVLQDGEEQMVVNKLREQNCYWNPPDRSKKIEDISIRISLDTPDGPKEVFSLEDLVSRWGLAVNKGTDGAAASESSSGADGGGAPAAEAAEPVDVVQEVIGDPAKTGPQEEDGAAAQQQAVSEAPVEAPAEAPAEAPSEESSEEGLAPNAFLEPAVQAGYGKSEFEFDFDDGVRPVEPEEETELDGGAPEGGDSASSVAAAGVASEGSASADESVSDDAGKTEGFEELKKDAEARFGKGVPEDVANLLSNPPDILFMVCYYVNRRLGLGYDYSGYRLANDFDEAIEECMENMRDMSPEELFGFVSMLSRGVSAIRPADAGGVASAVGAEGGREQVKDASGNVVMEIDR